MRINKIDTLKAHQDYIRAISYKELMKAAHQCACGVMWKSSVINWMFEKEVRCARLHKQLVDGTYKIQRYLYFRLNSPKPRLISSTKFTDRVVQRSLCNNGLYDMIAKQLIYDNCACLKEKGTKFAFDRFVKKLRHYLRVNGRVGYVLTLDVHKFFDCAQHDKLKEILSRHVPEGGFYDRVEEIIDSFHDIRKSSNIEILTEKKCGIGLGSQISQLLMLTYLNELDHEIVQKFHNVTYVRYMDDMILVCKTLEEAKILKQHISDFLHRHFLKLNRKSKISSIKQPIQFLKVRISVTESLKLNIHMSKKAFARQCQRMKKMFKKLKTSTNKISMNVIIDEFNSWFGSNSYKMSRKQKSLIVRKFKICLNKMCWK